MNKLLPGYFDVLARLDDFKVVRLDESSNPIFESTQLQLSKVVVGWWCASNYRDSSDLNY